MCNLGIREKKKSTAFRWKPCLFWSIAAVIVLLNLVAWNSTAFCDWYIAYIFPVWVNTYGRVTGLFPFSVGEWLIAAGLAVVAAAVGIGAVWGIWGLAAAAFGKRRKEQSDAKQRETEQNKAGQRETGQNRVRQPETGQGGTKSCGESRYTFFCRFAKGYYLFFAWTLLAVCLIMTLNCFILYHASTFSEHYFGKDSGEYTAVELISLYNQVAGECNRLSARMERDADGEVLYTGSGGVLKEASYHTQLRDMADTAILQMKRLGKEYEQLDGWYPRPKAMFFSDFMCQQYMQGYYFPFSMEANYNDVMHILNIPATMCHELAHLRGYIFEDEANFISYLACVQSEDEFFRYAGNLSVLSYLYNDVYKLKRNNPTVYEAALQEITPVAVTEQVWKDDIFVSEKEWERINAKALIDTETVDKAADVFIDTNLKVNGVSDGAISYSRVVRLLLQYSRQEKTEGKN